MKEYLQKLVSGKDLTKDEMYNAILSIMKNEVPAEMTGHF